MNALYEKYVSIVISGETGTKLEIHNDIYSTLQLMPQPQYNSKFQDFICHLFSNIGHWAELDSVNFGCFVSSKLWTLPL